MSVLSQSALVPGRAWCVLGLACALLLGGCSTTPAPGPSRSVASSLSDEHAHDIAIHALGLVNILGGCCGTTPDHIGAIAKAVAPVKTRQLFYREPTALA